MTNGEKLVKVFPDIELYKKMHGGIQIDFDSVWWNAEYKEPTTKNDLGVDCVARQDIERYIEGFINEYTPKEELEFINLELDGLKHLPSVTPIRPKGHWIDHSDDGYVECPKCGSATNCDDNIADLHFCFSCGADMRGEE